MILFAWMLSVILSTPECLHERISLPGVMKHEFVSLGLSGISGMFTKAGFWGRFYWLQIPTEFVSLGLSGISGMFTKAGFWGRFYWLQIPTEFVSWTFGDLGDVHKSRFLGCKGLSRGLGGALNLRCRVKGVRAGQAGARGREVSGVPPKLENALIHLLAASREVSSAAIV
ncbi:hypothetical protein C8F04DRAFT_1186557 [Mycena alexandri]|uniref:Uncharacterized protein n=1 Tax=Mycena alexandri TaxID=1745969 RepID=A0AAD6SQI2_9AGAR|nr:hypothetical protein C8F04DRAFT_1186557 [Mycena alexandri]